MWSRMLNSIYGYFHALIVLKLIIQHILSSDAQGSIMLDFVPFNKEIDLISFSFCGDF